MTRANSRVRIGVVAALAVLLAGGSLPVHGEGESEIRYKSRDLDKVKAEINKKREEKERLNKEAEDLSVQLKQNRAKVQDVEQTLVHTRKKNFEIEQQVAGMKNRHDSLLSDVDQANEGYNGAIHRYYVASLIEGASAPGPVYGRHMLHYQAVKLKDLTGKKDEAGKNLQELVDTEQILRGEVLKQQLTLSDIRNGIESKERLLTKKMTRQEALEAEVKDLEKTSKELASMIDTLRSNAKAERESERKARLQKQASGASPIPAHSLTWPVRGRVAMRFGRQTHPTLGTPFINNGIVIAIDQSKPIAAVSDGKILFAGDFMSYGSMVVIEHAGDWYTVYGRLSRWQVEKGQEIKKGEIVGWPRQAENGGLETYFELRFYGKPTDPLPWLVQ
jgi:septal ring factor EnvC (AmiA/AmiB activator)